MTGITGNSSLSKYMGKMLKSTLGSAIGNNGDNGSNGNDGNTGDQTPYDPKIFTPPPIICEYLKYVRLNGCLGVDDPIGEMELIPVTNTCTGSTTNIVAFNKTQEEVVASLGHNALICDGEQVLPDTLWVEGNSLTIPAGWNSISFTILDESTIGAGLYLNGQKFVYCCKEDLLRELNAALKTTGNTIGQEVTIRVCADMMIQVNVCCEHIIQPDPIEVEPTIVSAWGECYFDKTDSTFKTICFQIDNCGGKKAVVFSTGRDVTDQIDDTLCKPEAITSSKIKGDLCGFILKEDEFKKDAPVFMFREWCDALTQVNCWTADVNNIADPPKEDESNLIDISKYINMKQYNFVRRPGKDLLVIPMDKNPVYRLTGTGAKEDVLAKVQALIDSHIAAIVAKGFVVPEGGELKATCISIQPIVGKREIIDDSTKAPADITSEDMVLIENTLPGGDDSTEMYPGDDALNFGKFQIEHPDCDGCAVAGCELLAGELSYTAETNQGIQVCFDLGCVKPLAENKAAEEKN